MKIPTGGIRADHGTVSFLGSVRRPPRLHRLAAEGLFYLPVDQPLLSSSLSVGEHLMVMTGVFGGGNLRMRPVVSGSSICLLETKALALSTGEVRRVGVALALVRRPICLLADEPFRNVDPFGYRAHGRRL